MYHKHSNNKHASLALNKVGFHTQKMANPTIRRIKCALGTTTGNQIIPLVKLIIIDIPVVFYQQFGQ